MIKTEQTGEKSVAVGVNHGNIYINYGNKKIPKYLTSAPFQSSIFEGRATALREVHDLLFGGQSFLMLVNGQGGIGKTTFAAKYWQKYEKEYTHLGVLYVGSGIANALTNREFTNNLGIVFPENITEQETLQIVFENLAKLNKPCLLILDNANDAEDLGKHAVALGKCVNCHILLTSRLENFANTHKYSLGALDKVAALQVFQQNYEFYEPTDETLFYEIFEAVGGNTLVMELLAKNLNNFNRNKQNYSLQNLYDDLQKSLLNLSKSKEVNTAYQAQGTGFRNEKPEVIILAMYDLSELSEPEIALLSAFAVLPPENIAFTSLETLLNSETLEDSLEKLTQKGWIEFDKTTKSYKISPVVQEIVRYKNKERLFGDCEGIIGVLINDLHPERNDNYHQDNYKLTTLYNYYAESIVNLYLSIILFEFKELIKINYNIAVLCERIGNFYTIIGNINKALEFYEAYLEINEQLVDQNPRNPIYKNGLAIFYSKLGETYSTLGNLDKALEFFERMNNLFKELYVDYPTNVSIKNGLATSYEKLGKTYSNLGNLDKALESFEVETKLSEELYATHFTNVNLKSSLAISYQYLGETHSILGNLDKALEFFTQYNQLKKELYIAYPTNVRFKDGLAISYSKLGETHSTLNNLDKALEFFEDMKKLFQELCAAYPTNVNFKNGLAISFSKLGETYAALGNLGKTLFFFVEMNYLFRDLYVACPTNVSFKNGLAISYIKLGFLYENMDKQKAKSYYLECKKYYVELVQISPAYAEFQKNLEWVENKLADL